MGLGKSVFQSLLFLVLTTAFMSFIGFRENDFFYNLKWGIILFVTSWVVVLVLWGVGHRGGKTR